MITIIVIREKTAIAAEITVSGASCFPIGSPVSKPFEKVVEEIEKELASSGMKEVPAAQIGEEVMKHLRDLDQVASVRFASVYREFKDVTEFMDELTHLLKSHH